MEVNRDLLQALDNLEKLGLTGKATYVRQASTARESVVEDISKTVSYTHLTLPTNSRV